MKSLQTFALLATLSLTLSAAAGPCALQIYKWEMDKNSEQLTANKDACLADAAQEEKRIQQAENERLKRPGVRIGMTAKQVLASSWGEPSEVNRTTTLRGTREQWVYRSRNYLYLDNGKVSAIQN